MRPVRLTGVTGTSQPVPLDVYAPAGQAQVNLASAGAPTLEITVDNVFDLSITPVWKAPTVATANTLVVLPPGTRAVRGVGMIAADVLSVSQQGLA